MILICLLISAHSVFSQKLIYTDSQRPVIKFVLDSFTYENINTGYSIEKAIRLNGIFLPGEPGKPDLPAINKLLTIPVGAKISYKIISLSTEKISGVNIAPAPTINKINEGNL